MPHKKTSSLGQNTHPGSTINPRSKTMPKSCSLDIRKMRNRFFKQLTIGLFFILPVKITNVFVSLSIVSLILKLRELDPTSNERLVKKLGEVLKMNISPDTFLLPQQTFDWYWSPAVLNTPLDFEGRRWTVAELLSDRDSFLKHRNTVMNILLDSLPSAIKIKLGLYANENRLSLKHKIVSAIAYA